MKLRRVYGVTIGCEHDFESPLLPAPKGSQVDLRFEMTTDPVPLSDDASGAPLAGIRVTDVVDFRIFADRIVAHVPAGEPDTMAEIHFLSSAMTTWLEYRGALALHASAVVIDGQAVAFMATSRGGKTGLAAALVAKGYGLLTDDILALKVDPGQQGIRPGFNSRISANPGYPQMRMWPDGAEYFVGEAWRQLPIVHRAYRKVRVPIGTGLFGAFHSEPATLGAIIIPTREERDKGDQTSTFESAAPLPPENGEFWFERLGPTEAMLELTQNTFSPRAIEDRGLQPQRLARLARLVEIVPIFRFRYPSGYAHLPDVADAVVGIAPMTRPRI